MNIKQILLPAVLVSTAVQLNAKTIYTECFDRYADYPLNLNQGVHISEMPASEKILSVRPANKQYTKAFKTPLSVPEKKRCANAELSFRICTMGDNPDNAYDAILQFADNSADKTQTWKTAVVHLSGSSGTSLSGDLWNGNPNELRLSPNLTQLTPFSNGQWYDVKIRITDNYICVYTNRDKERLETRAKLPEGVVLAGVNFGGTTAFNIDDIKVETAEGMSAPVTTEYGACINPQEGKLSWNANDGELKFRISNIGYPAKITFTFSDGGENPVVCNLESFIQRASRPAVKTVQEEVGDKKKTVKKVADESVLLEDSGLKFTCDSFHESFYTVPKLEGRFEEFQKRSIVREALDGKLANAGDKIWHFRLVCCGEKVQLWVEGNYLMDIPLKNKLRTFTAEAPYGSRFESNFEKKDSNISQIFPVELFPEQKFIERTAETKQKVFSGKYDFDRYGFDTGKCRQYLGSFDLECDGYLSRSAFEAIPNSMIRRVPNAQYVKAYVVCSLGKNDPERSTDVTARLTRFITSDAGRTPAAMAMQTISLPRDAKEPLPHNVKSLGDGKYMVTFDLPIEKIQDLVFMEKSNYLDFEVLGGLYEKNNYYCSNEGKPSLRPSNVVVHYACLEQQPVSMMVENGSVANLFYPSEKPHVVVKLCPEKTEKGLYSLSWTVRDVDGKIVEQGTDDVTLDAGKTADFVKNFKQTELGHYDYCVQLSKKGEKSFLRYDGSFALLAEDTRKAGYDSPYFSWNFRGAHGTPRDPEIFGTIFKRMGIRRAWGWEDESSVPAKYGEITQGHFSNLRASGETPEEREESLKNQILDLTKRYPHVRSAMIFHESAGGPSPLELIGEKTEITPDLQQSDKKLADRALELADAWRKYAPHVKLVIGNTGVSLGAAGRLFRAKYPAEKIDFLGEESVGMSMPPERSVAYPSWMLRELAKMYGYDNVKPEACYEWKDRVERDSDTPRICAAYRVRDILVALAWNYQLIPVGSICDVGNSYYNTIWGAGSATRYPLLQPYPAMTAVSVATQVLDRVKNARLVPTGSPTVYFLEFQRDGEYVYAGWTVRGVVNLNMDFGNTKVKCVDFFGRKSELKTKTVSLSEEPCYFISGTPVKSVSAAMSRTYPREQYPGMDKMNVVSAMDNPENWNLAEGEDSRLKVPLDEVYLSAMRPGKFRLSGVQDEEKGKCLEVSLIPEGECPDLMREYGFIRLNKSELIAENANTVGLWVKGNSSWGKIFFELEDADGEIWLSAGTGGYGCPVYDWEEKTGINFDGWHFIQFPVTSASPVKVHSPGDNQWQWQSEHNGDGQITYPLKLRGIGFALSRKTLNLVEMEPVKNLSIRFKNFSAY